MSQPIFSRPKDLALCEQTMPSRSAGSEQLSHNVMSKHGNDGPLLPAAVGTPAVVVPTQPPGDRRDLKGESFFSNEKTL